MLHKALFVCVVFLFPTSQGACDTTLRQRLCLLIREARKSLPTKSGPTVYSIESVVASPNNSPGKRSRCGGMSLGSRARWCVRQSARRTSRAERVVVASSAERRDMVQSNNINNTDNEVNRQSTFSLLLHTLSSGASAAVRGRQLCVSVSLCVYPTRCPSASSCERILKLEMRTIGRFESHLIFGVGV